ncbi:heavy-metal-associated domain-containing protein [Mycolicibacterium psychrotolerans]|uniref:heavy-metal-associated domain-containing protein n=1 Tax=Mycolicibacterium psychrotolerans TaxID=216929 RepID=UPI003D67F3E0
MSQTFKVTGLHCQSCVRVVTGALAALPTVSAVDIDLDPEGASIVRVDGEVTVDQVREALADEDYTVIG